MKDKTTRRISETSLAEPVGPRIITLRGQRVILDANLAEIYGVETRVLNQAVKRNADRFPEDFMFQLAPDEWEHLKSQNVMSSMQYIEAQDEGWSRAKNATTSKHGGRRKLPYAFTEHGAIMAATVLKTLKSPEA